MSNADRTTKYIKPIINIKLNARKVKNKRTVAVSKNKTRMLNIVYVYHACKYFKYGY